MVRTITDICQEFDEVVPTWIDLDAARAIIFVCLVFWIAASFVHAAPNSVQRIAFFFGSSIAVAKTSACTSARNDIAGLKMGDPGDVGVSTIALTQPVDSTSGIFASWPNRGQLSKALVGYVQRSATAARLNMAIAKVRGDNDMGVAAVALAEPSPTFGALSAYSIELSDCNQSAKTLIRDIDGFAHSGLPERLLTGSGEIDVESISLAAQSITETEEGKSL